MSTTFGIDNEMTSTKKVVNSKSAETFSNSVTEDNWKYVDSSVRTDGINEKFIQGTMNQGMDGMKTSMYVQYFGNEISSNAVIQSVKQSFSHNGHTESDIKTMDVYIKPEENAAYYVINGKDTGSVNLVR